MTTTPGTEVRELRISADADPARAWLHEVAAHREVLGSLAQKDFQTRYKRASFGVLWAIVLPVLQAAILAVVFSRVARFQLEDMGVGFGAYVMSGMLMYSYFATTLPSTVTAIVDGATLAEKVWFPRILLVIVPVVANAAGFVVSSVVGLALCPILGGHLSVRSLLVVPAGLLVAALLVGLGGVLAAAHVYFRDVKFLVQAAMLVWLYVTPVIYPRSLLDQYSGLLDINPLTGPVALFHAAFGVQGDPVLRPALVTLAYVVVLGIATIEIHRRHDRLFVDLL